MSERLGALIQTRRIKRAFKEEKELCDQQEKLLNDQENDLLDQLTDQS